MANAAFVFLFYLALVSQLVHAQNSTTQTCSKAVAVLLFGTSANGTSVNGTISFSQSSPTANVEIVGVINGLGANTEHGIHIHENGDDTNNCTSAGLHYNPLNTQHGSPMSSQHHAGDMGNFMADDNGTIHLVFETQDYSLCNVLGRAIVIHAGKDDFVSQPVGNSGARLACGIIAVAAIPPSSASSSPSSTSLPSTSSAFTSSPSPLLGLLLPLLPMLPLLLIPL